MGPPSRKRKRILGSIAKAAVGMAIFAWLAGSGTIDFASVGQALSLRPGMVLLAFGLYLAANFATAIRWYILLRCLKHGIPFRRVFSLHMVGLFFVTILPGGTGGDLVKGYYLYRDTPNRRGQAVLSIVMDRLIGVYALLCWGMCGVLINLKNIGRNPILSANAWFFLGLFTVATAFIGIFFSPWFPRSFEARGRWRTVVQKLEDLNQTLRAYRSRGSTLAAAFGLSLGVHGILLLAYYAAALSLNVDLTLLQHVSVAPMLTMINGLPISPAGIGVGEAGAEFLYKTVGLDKGAEIFVIYHCVFLVAALAGAPFFLAYKAALPVEPEGGR